MMGQEELSPLTLGDALEKVNRREADLRAQVEQLTEAQSANERVIDNLSHACDRLERQWAELITALNIMARMPAESGHALLVEELETRGLLEPQKEE